MPPQRGVKYFNTTPGHTDANLDHCVMIYYVNDCDGETLLYKTGKIKPKRGRIVLFDGSISHKIKYPTKGYRCVLNFNFIRKMFNLFNKKKEVILKVEEPKKEPFDIIANPALEEVK